MPKFQKRYPPRSGYYGPVAKRVNTYGPAAMQLAKDVAYLTTLVNSEPKWHVVQSANNFNWAGAVVDLSAISTGGSDDSFERSGQTVLPRFLTFRCHLNKSVSGVSDHTTVRMLVFRYWGEDSTAAAPIPPVAADIIRTPGTQYAPMSVLNRDNTGSRGDRQRRIEILRSEQITLDKVSLTSKDFHYNIEMNGTKVPKKEHIKFDSNATASAISGGIYVLFLSDVTTTTDMSYTVVSNLTFYDN